MDAIVIAGGIPQPKDTLYKETQGGYKTLLDISGKPMIQWVVDALNQAEKVDHILLVGLPIFTEIRSDKPLIPVEDHHDLLANIHAGINQLRELHPDAKKVLVVSGDIPAIQPYMVDWCIDRILESDEDVYYNVIERSTMEKRFPGSKRSYTPLKDVEVCGGDINGMSVSIVDNQTGLWEHLIEARKSSLRQASLLGYDTLLLLVLRRLALEDAARIVSKRLGLKGRVMLCPYAEMGMDIDKPHQLDILRHDLARVN